MNYTCSKVEFLRISVCISRYIGVTLKAAATKQL